MTTRQRWCLRQRRIGKRLVEPGGIDNLAFDPREVRLAGHRLDDKAYEAVAVVRVFEARVGFDGRRGRELSPEFLGVEEGPPVEELTAVGPVTDDARAVGKQLGNRHSRDRGV